MSAINLKQFSAIPTKSTLSNLDAIHVDGSRQSVPVTKKTKTVDKVSDVSNKTTDKVSDVSMKAVGNSSKNETLSNSTKNKTFLNSTKTETISSTKTEKVSSTGRPRQHAGGYALDGKGCFKRRTPMTAMRLSDPRSEKLTIGSLRRRFGVAANPTMASSFRSATITRLVKLNYFIH